MINTVFILGNHIQALGLARQINSFGIDVVLFTSSRLSITRFSNSISKCQIYRNEDDLMSKINCHKNRKKEILLFPTNDNMVDFLSQKYEQLNENFHLGIPYPEIVKTFADKRNTYEFAKKHQIPTPNSFFSNSMDEIEQGLSEFHYPVIIKPAFMHTFHNIYGKKAYKCMDKSQLFENLIQISRKIPLDQLMIQEFLDGGPKLLYSYGSFSVDGRSIASLMVNRTRQNPMTFGNSTTYAITCNIPEIRIQAEKILKLTNYSGLAEIEFMYDEKTRQYKFLEINTRAWKWHSISEGLGFSFIGKLLAYYNSDDYSEIMDYDKVCGWIERLTDTAVVLKEFVRGNNLIKDVIKSYSIPRVYAVWSPQDLLPFVMYILLSPLLFFKRH